jgi:hypothetical protein
VVRVRRVRLLGSHDRRRRDETGHVVDVAVGIVPLDPVAQPEDPIGAEIVADPPLHDLPRPRGLARKQAVRLQQAGLGREHRPLPVAVHGPALQDESGPEAARSAQLRDPARNGVVPLPGRVLLPPGIEAEVHQRRPPVGRLQEDRAVVAHPGVVRRVDVEIDALLDAGLPEEPPHPVRHGRVLDVDTERLAAVERPGHGHEGALRLLQGTGPGVRVVGPGEPGAGVLLPLGRPAAARRARGIDHGGGS